MKKSMVALMLVSLLSLAALAGCGKSPDFVDATGSVIEQEAAIEIALTHAGISREQVYDLEAELDREWGVLLYEVSFESGGREYEYDINATSGEIRSHRAERDR